MARNFVRFSNDEGPDYCELEISYEGNLDWYFTLLPKEEDIGKVPLHFRVATSGTQLPEPFVFIAALLFHVGRDDWIRASELADTLAKVLRERK